MKLLLALALASALTVCDSNGVFTGNPDSFDCVSGATLTATIEGATSGNTSLTGVCVEVSPGSSGNSLNVGAFSDPVGSSGNDYARSVSITVGGRTVGTYSFGSATTFGNYSTSTSASSTLAASNAGQAVITEASGGRIRGTFRFTAREEVTPSGSQTTRTGQTVTVSGAFDLPG